MNLIIFIFFLHFEHVIQHVVRNTNHISSFFNMGLIKTKRNQVALNCSTKTSGITPVEYAAFVIVELIPITILR